MNRQPAPHLILASASPRRHELLRKLLAAFDVETSQVEEKGEWLDLEEPSFAPVSLPAPFYVPPEADPRLWAWRKTADVACRHVNSPTPGVYVLGADTVVVGPGQLLGKPKSEQEALRMLQLLRGRDHHVATGFALLLAIGGSVQTLWVDVCTSRVVFGMPPDADLMRYVATGEPMDKAGAYALQGLAGEFVERVEGCRTNVVGLPLCAVRVALEKAHIALSSYPPDGYCPHCPLLNRE